MDPRANLDVLEERKKSSAAGIRKLIRRPAAYAQNDLVNRMVVIAAVVSPPTVTVLHYHLTISGSYLPFCDALSHYSPLSKAAQITVVPNICGSPV